MKRRNLLLSAPAIIATAPMAMAARAAAPAQGGQSQSQSFTVGEMRLTVISDGFLPMGPEIMVGIDAETYAAALQASHFPGDVYTGGVAGYLIESNGQRILIDSGTGPGMGPSLGGFGDNLIALGIDPTQIDLVLATHLHPDHIGGLLTDVGASLSGASFVVADADRAFWTDDAIKAQFPAAFQPFFDMAAGAIALFGGSGNFVSGETQVAPSITAIPLPGHTPGHSGYLLESEGESLLIWGDIIHAAPFQLPNPDVGIAFDVDGEEAIATRKRTLDMVATDGLRIAGSHMPFPGVGHLEKVGDGYRFLPAHWEYS